MRPGSCVAVPSSSSWEWECPLGCAGIEAPVSLAEGGAIVFVTKLRVGCDLGVRVELGLGCLGWMDGLGLV